MSDGEDIRGRGDTTNNRPAEDTPVVELHEPIYREMAEPRDGFEPPPSWLVFLCLAIMGFAGWYLGMYSGGFRADIYDETGWQSGGGEREAPAVVRLDPMVLGQRVYNNCMACHQRDGRGVPGNYPPLDGSTWVQDRPVALAALVLHGLEGPVEVLGETYNQVMPKWSHLTDEQLAAVLTFVRGSWGNRAGAIEPSFVAAVRAQTTDRNSPWTAGELELFEDVFVPPAIEPDSEDTTTEGRVSEVEGPESPAPVADLESNTDQ
jgi:mono/diheme cytochrome c family protein